MVCQEQVSLDSSPSWSKSLFANTEAEYKDLPWAWCIFHLKSTVSQTPELIWCIHIAWDLPQQLCSTLTPAMDCGPPRAAASQDLSVTISWSLSPTAVAASAS